MTASTTSASPAMHPAITPGKVAVITGGASGIGLAAAKQFAILGMHVVIADLSTAALAEAKQQIDATIAAAHTSHDTAPIVRTIVTDVSQFASVQSLAEQAADIGPVAVLMNNAGIGPSVPSSWQGLAQWQTLLQTNLWGAIHGVHAFAPGMIARGERALIVNTGSKQGITLPPGNAAYNLSKAGVRAYTESLAHDLRGVAAGAVTAHLLIPGFTHTGMTARGADKPPAAWTPEQVITFMLESLARNDFYILCPDNDVTRAIDEKRIQWMAEDLIRNRPALSRWHPDHAAAFAAFMQR